MPPVSQPPGLSCLGGQLPALIVLLAKLGAGLGGVGAGEWGPGSGSACGGRPRGPPALAECRPPPFRRGATALPGGRRSRHSRHSRQSALAAPGSIAPPACLPARCPRRRGAAAEARQVYEAVCSVVGEGAEEAVPFSLRLGICQAGE